MGIENNKIRLYLLLGLLIALVLLLIGIVYYSSKANKDELSATEEETPSSTGQAVFGKVIPTDAKTPKEFLDKVQEKAQEIQKNYDSNLAEFAEKKWKNIFQEYNNVGQDFLRSNVKIVSKEVQKETDQSIVFRIKYKLLQGDKTIDAEDFFFLILSEAKKSELGAGNLKQNTFLSEEEIKKNINKEGFAKITKIQ